jgi:hypothetical protein
MLSFTEGDKENEEETFVIYVCFCRKTTLSFPPNQHFEEKKNFVLFIAIYSSALWVTFLFFITT